jgi:hypothetical protein
VTKRKKKKKKKKKSVFEYWNIMLCVFACGPSLTPFNPLFLLLTLNFIAIVRSPERLEPERVAALEACARAVPRGGVGIPISASEPSRGWRSCAESLALIAQAATAAGRPETARDAAEALARIALDVSRVAGCAEPPVMWEGDVGQ